MRITESDYKQWWSSPVGLEVKEMLLDRLNIISAMVMDESVINDQVKSAICVGRYQEIKDLLNMNFNELMGE